VKAIREQHRPALASGTGDLGEILVKCAWMEELKARHDGNPNMPCSRGKAARCQQAMTVNVSPMVPASSA
jgi:hypothetical protein